jgi:rhodanese-related sulfurtransferase
MFSGPWSSNGSMIGAAVIDDSRKQANAGQAAPGSRRHHVGGPGMVIVGAGQAGGRAAQTLREHGYDGRIVLLGGEHGGGADAAAAA